MVEHICGLVVPLRRLDGRIGRRVDERARAYIAAGLRAVLAAPVARGCEATSTTPRWIDFCVGLLKDAALLPVARLPRLRPRGVHALRHAVPAVPVARQAHALTVAHSIPPGPRLTLRRARSSLEKSEGRPRDQRQRAAVALRLVPLRCQGVTRLHNERRVDERRRATARGRVARGVSVSSREQVDEAVGAESCGRVHERIRTYTYIHDRIN